jgi:hypothetical protein
MISLGFKGFSKNRYQKNDTMMIPGNKNSGQLNFVDSGTKFRTNIPTSGERGTWSRYKL